MKHILAGRHRRQFELVAKTRSAQAAVMTLRPGGESESTPGNEHPHSEQWLFVLSGVGQALVGRRRSSLRRVKLRKHSLLVVEKGELHQIRNTGARPLTTINIYVPPAYGADGEPK